MEIIEIIKKQEEQSKIALSVEERNAAIKFFQAREAEKDALLAVNPEKIIETRTDSAKGNRLRDDTAAPSANRHVFLSQAPDTDGDFVRVPKTLAGV